MDETTARRQELYDLLGDLPDRDHPVTARTVARETRDRFALERLVLDLNGSEPVPALLTTPTEADGPFPTILYNHSHGGRYDIGKAELLDGAVYLHDPPYAEVLASRGIAALCIDHWLFGERSGQVESAFCKQMLWTGRCVWGMMVYDSLRAVDYLHTREDIDPARIGTLGMSMGSTMGWWLAALEPRIKFCVDLCCLTDFQALIDAGGLDGHGLYYYVPSLLKHFTTAQINALIAPRPHLALAGTKDPLTPPTGLERIDAELREVYAAAGQPDAWQLLRCPCAHRETAEMRAAILDFLETRL